MARPDLSQLNVNGLRKLAHETGLKGAVVKYEDDDEPNFKMVERLRKADLIAALERHFGEEG